MTLQFADMKSSSNYFDVTVFLLSSLVTGPSVMSKSSLFLELWQFSFKRDWLEIRKSKILSRKPSWVMPNIWNKLWIQNLAQMSQTKNYKMRQNARVTAFSVFELSRENQHGVKIPPTEIRFKPLIYGIQTV